jgi:hypothetical protein
VNHPPPNLVIFACIAALCILAAVVWMIKPGPVHGPFSGSDMLRDATFASTMPAQPWRNTVDPWVIQRDLMDASGQDLPQSPQLTHGALLYAALNMEEQAETFDAMAKAMRMHFLLVPFSCTVNMDMIASYLESTVAVMAANSRHLRDLLANTKMDPIPLGMSEAIESSTA